MVVLHMSLFTFKTTIHYLILQLKKKLLRSFLIGNNLSITCFRVINLVQRHKEPLQIKDYDKLIFKEKKNRNLGTSHLFLVEKR